MLGLVDGVPAVVLEHVTRLRADLCPEWPQPAQPGGSYRIEISGEPCYAMDICLSSRHGDHNHAGLVATAMRIVNDPCSSGRRTGYPDNPRPTPDHR